MRDCFDFMQLSFDSAWLEDQRLQSDEEDPEHAIARAIAEDETAIEKEYP